MGRENSQPENIGYRGGTVRFPAGDKYHSPGSRSAPWDALINDHRTPKEFHHRTNPKRTAHHIPNHISSVAVETHPESERAANYLLDRRVTLGVLKTRGLIGGQATT